MFFIFFVSLQPQRNRADQETDLCKDSFTWTTNEGTTGKLDVAQDGEHNLVEWLRDWGY